MKVGIILLMCFGELMGVEKTKYVTHLLPQGQRCYLFWRYICVKI